jgi:N-acetylmuramoyl-L-alanine amidase
MAQLTILGGATRTVDQMNAWLKHKGCPEYAASYALAGIEFGVRWDVAIFQSCLETGWFWQNDGPFDVKPEQHNYAGLGATGGGVTGDSFPDTLTGVRAQLQDLALRAGKQIPREQVLSAYVRRPEIYEIVANRGSVYWADLAGTWATDKNYWVKIQAIMADFDKWASTSPTPPVEPPKPPPSKKSYWVEDYQGGILRLVEEPGSIHRHEWRTDNVNTELAEAFAEAAKAGAGKRAVAGAFKELPALIPFPETKPVDPSIVVMLDPGHSRKAPGARSRDGRVREELVNEAACDAMFADLKGVVGVAQYNPDPDDLVSVGKKGWGTPRIMISWHHNSYGSAANPQYGNPYVCAMVLPSAPKKTKLFAQKVSRAIVEALKGTPEETKIFEGTSGMEGVYETGLTVLNTSAKDPDGNPPIHILVEAYFLNKFSDESQCIRATEKAAHAVSQVILAELKN